MLIENQRFDEERALYGSRGLTLKNCAFDGAADGESALKECRDITAENLFCNLRYPFWHDENLKITRTEMTDLCRAAIARDKGAQGVPRRKDKRLRYKLSRIRLVGNGY